jgi:transcriptional regulator of acetoin/glycerol metabolism
MVSTATRHIDNVLAIATGSATLAARSAPESLFHQSWTRCVKQHGLDPTRPTPARILPTGQVREHQQRLDGLLRVARAGMEDLYRRVVDLGYMVLLTDVDGVTVDYIGNPASEQLLKAAGLYLGADWNEAHAGTCGVGTCLIEQKTITCHQAEHFDASHIALTCTSAPLFAPDGQMLGVLDISALHSPEARESQHLVLQLASMYAQFIEDANFLRTFSKHWILRLGKAYGLVEVSGDVMFAFDDDGVIVGANTGARRRFGNPNGQRSGLSTLVGQTLHEALDIDMDALRNMARSGGTLAVSGLWSLQREVYHPVLIPPRQAISALAGASIAAPASIQAPQAADCAASAFSVGVLRSDQFGHQQDRPILDQLLGGDPVMQRLVDQAKRLVDRKVNLLVSGETGSGKEVLARALHAYSARAGQPFVAVNCASIPESLIESELFGYTPGSFTGGKSKGMKGLITQSDGGTLFLDEIGDMPLALQTRFLRVLSESEVVPLGAERPIPVVLNVIAATHRDLRESVEAGSFREDLYYRLSGATLHLPPLRDREDKSYLIHRVFDEEASRLGVRVRLLPQSMTLLMAHPWPGNLRELRNALRFALAVAGERAVTPDDLPPEIRVPRMPRSVPSGAWQALPVAMVDTAAAPPSTDRQSSAGAASPAAIEVGLDLVLGGDTCRSAEAARLVQALRANKWGITATAAQLGLCRATIYRQMKRHDITPPHLM